MYFIWLIDWIFFSDGDQIPDEFLEELLQLNQRVHLAEQPEQITALVGELTWHQDQLLAQLQQSFRQKDFQTACTLFQRLMFYASALKRAEEKNLWSCDNLDQHQNCTLCTLCTTRKGQFSLIYSFKIVIFVQDSSYKTTWNDLYKKLVSLQAASNFKFKPLLDGS